MVLKIERKQTDFNIHDKDVLAWQVNPFSMIMRV